MMKRCCRILSPTAILGYGFPEAAFARGLELDPDVIAVDAGSVDPGPYYLGAGVPFTDHAGVKRDLRFMVQAGLEREIPVLVGTAGGSGARPHLDWALTILREILHELNATATVGVIPADIDREQVLAAVAAGKTKPLSGLPELTADVVNRTGNIVAQMGMDPFQKALAAGCDIVLAGRAYDPSVFAAYPVQQGFDPGLAIHLGKILECAAIAADPGSGAECVLGELYDDSFVLVPLSDDRVFTRESVAAHSLYEKSDPYCLPGPGGHLDLRDVSFTEEGNGRVRVAGSRFVPDDGHWIKLEGAEPVGCRTISIAGTRDPVMISGIDTILTYVEDRMAERLAEEGIEGDLHFHVYGRDGVMAALEPTPTAAGHELGIVIEALAATQELANTICSITRSTLLHYGYPGRISTAGNLAFPFSPSDIKAGPVYVFSIYHLMELPEHELFPVEVLKL